MDELGKVSAQRWPSRAKQSSCWRARAASCRARGVAEEAGTKCVRRHGRAGPTIILVASEASCCSCGVWGIGCLYQAASCDGVVRRGGWGRAKPLLPTHAHDTHGSPVGELNRLCRSPGVSWGIRTCRVGAWVRFVEYSVGLLCGVSCG